VGQRRENVPETPLLVTIYRHLREYRNRHWRAYFNATLTGANYYAELMDRTSAGIRTMTRRANQAGLDMNVEIVNMNEARLSDSAGIPGHGTSPYGVHLPEGTTLAALTAGAQTMVFDAGRPWQVIRDNSFLSGIPGVVHAYAEDARFTIRYHLQGPLLVANLANAIWFVAGRLRSGGNNYLKKFRIIFYNRFHNSEVAGGARFSLDLNPDVTEQYIRDSVEMLLNGYIQSLADGAAEPGSDPAALPAGVESEEDEMPADSMLQNCAVEYVPNRSLVVGDPTPVAVPPVEMKLVINNHPTCFKIIDRDSPKYGRDGLSCAIEAVCEKCHMAYSHKMFRELPGDHKRDKYAIVDVLNCVSPHRRGDFSYVCVAEDGVTVLSASPQRVKPFAPETEWLICWQHHVYVGRVVRMPDPIEEPDKKKRKKLSHEDMKDPVVTYDFETRAQVHDDIISKTGKRTGSTLVPTAAAIAYRGEDGKMVSRAWLLDTDLFMADHAKHTEIISKAIQAEELMEKLQLHSAANRRQLFLDCIQQGPTLASFTTGQRLKLPDEAFVEKITGATRLINGKKKGTKQTSQAATVKNIRIMQQAIARVSRVVFNKAYLTSKALPHFKMLLHLRTLPLALNMKNPRGKVLLYAHNAQSFDAYFLLNAVIELWREGIIMTVENIIMKPGRIMQFRFMYDTGAVFVARCSLALLGGSSLKDLGISYDLPPRYRKLETVDLPDGVTMSSMELCLMRPDLDPIEYVMMLKEKGYVETYMMYNRLDCVALHLVLHRSATKYGALLGDVPGTPEYFQCEQIFWRSISCSSMSMNMFKLHLSRYNPELFEAFKAMGANTSVDEWIHIKASIVGGASISGQPGLHLESTDYLDVNGQYPDALSNGLYTMGQLRQVDIDEDVKEWKCYRYDEDRDEYYDNDTGEILAPLDGNYLPGRKMYFTSGVYRLTGEFVPAPHKYWIRGMPIRGTGNLNWRADEFHEDPQTWCWQDLNRMVEGRELKHFTLWSDSWVADDDAYQVEGQALYAPFFKVLMDGKMKAREAGDTALATAMKLGGNGTTGSLQQNIFHQAVILNKSSSGSLYTTSPDIAPNKSVVMHAGEMLAYVRIKLFEMIDTVGRQHLITCETDGISFPSSLVHKLAPYIGDKPGQLMFEMRNTSLLITLAPKTYYMEGEDPKDPTKKTTKQAAKGLPRKLITPGLYWEGLNGNPVTVKMNMLMRNRKTLSIISQDHASRTLKALQGRWFPTFF
jgi:hypothetical protein